MKSGEFRQSPPGIEHGRMFYDVVDFELPSLKAILIEFSRLPAMLRLVGRFDRAVVLTDKDWLNPIIA